MLLGQDADDQLHGLLLAMEERAVMLRKVALARGTVALAQRAAMRMAMGAQIAQPEPAAIATAPMGTAMPGGVHRVGAPEGRGHGVGAYGKGGLGMCRMHIKRRLPSWTCCIETALIRLRMLFSSVHPTSRGQAALDRQEGATLGRLGWRLQAARH